MGGPSQADDDRMFEDIKARNMGAPRMFVPTSIIEPTLLNSKRIKKLSPHVFDDMAGMT